MLEGLRADIAEYITKECRFKDKECELECNNEDIFSVDFGFRSYCGRRRTLLGDN